MLIDSVHSKFKFFLPNTIDKSLIHMGPVWAHGTVLEMVRVVDYMV